MEFCKVFLTFGSVDEILWCDHSNKRSLPVLTYDAISHSKFHNMKFRDLVEICFWLSLKTRVKFGKFCVRCHFMKFDNYFSGSRKKFSLVLLQITNYISNPWKMWKRMQYFFKLFWYKVSVQWKFKLLNFLVDSVLMWVKKPCSGGSRGGARGPGSPPPPHLIFRPKWGPKGRKNIFFETGPRPYLRFWVTSPTPHPPYLKVWIRQCLEQTEKKLGSAYLFANKIPLSTTIGL